MPTPRRRRRQPRTTTSAISASRASSTIFRSDSAPYLELGPDYLLRRNNAEAYTQRLARQLERLGHKVSLEPLSVAA